MDKFIETNHHKNGRHPKSDGSHEKFFEKSQTKLVSSNRGKNGEHRAGLNRGGGFDSYQEKVSNRGGGSKKRTGGR